MSLKRKLTAERARELFNYDPETGVLRRRADTAGKNAAKQLAPQVTTINKDGYLIARVDGYVYVAHRVIFLMMEGRWPSPGVDHINRNKTDNRWSNLREACAAINSINRVFLRNNPAPGVEATANTGRYRARVEIGGRRKRLGTYDTAAQAVAAIERHKAGLLL